VIDIGLIVSRDQSARDRALRPRAASYRAHSDTASGYQNEAEVGQGIRGGAIDRSEIFITTKLRPTDYGHDAALRAFDVSMSQLGLDVLDLYLLHWPVPRDFDNTVASWKVCERLLVEGRVRAIGVCNFKPTHLDRLIARSDVAPAVNQIELHPYFVQRDHDEAHKRLVTVTQAWSPIGSIQRYWPGDEKRDPLSDPVVTGLATRYGTTPAQIVLRWQIEFGHSIIPKSVHLHRIRENADIFDFSLSQDEVAAISALDTGLRGGPDPEVQGTPEGK
jgi:diketogulonate reductase-like aldo/keto reductase